MHAGPLEKTGAAEAGKPAGPRRAPRHSLGKKLKDSTGNGRMQKKVRRWDKSLVADGTRSEGASGETAVVRREKA